ncbi:hypothetical protein PP914_gp142 [Arthrobacter phage Qui]|uniref:Uncharacterized protein n=1 Tax=Arthrobacter phage Qui TaxID=2603260 RepID=A0A5B8WH51_9CAUD|nr:hypothetical protein PP914_gp142 [Arthrobacter phage Qui]QED11631.1 hypothetical protein SEA_QUI_142 [Arthrobacter phage Qui]QOC56463.1 hypothetical protein SEA_PAELLA_142 [Arthrobacter phage Paella]
MTIANLPEGFKLLPSRGTFPEFKKRRYAVSEKGEIFDLTTGKIHKAAEGETKILIRDEKPNSSHEVEFDIPILLATFFGGREEGLRQEDFDELVSISGLPADVCRARLDAGWRFESTTDGPNVSNKWVKPEAK